MCLIVLQNGYIPALHDAHETPESCTFAPPRFDLDRGEARWVPEIRLLLEDTKLEVSRHECIVPPLDHSRQTPGY